MGDHRSGDMDVHIDKSRGRRRVVNSVCNLLKEQGPQVHDGRGAKLFVNIVCCSAWVCTPHMLYKYNMQSAGVQLCYSILGLLLSLLFAAQR